MKLTSHRFLFLVIHPSIYSKEMSDSSDDEERKEIELERVIKYNLIFKSHAKLYFNFY